MAEIRLATIVARFERILIGTGMSMIAWLLEKAVFRSVRSVGEISDG